MTFHDDTGGSGPMGPDPDRDDLIGTWRASGVDPVVLYRTEETLMASVEGRDALGSTISSQRLEMNRRVVLGLAAAPRRGRLERSLVRLGVSDSVARLATATPALRAAWLVSTFLALLFALATASSSTASGLDRVIVYLTIAPLVPLAGVALAFGSAVDPVHETTVATPIDRSRLLLIRTMTILVTSIAILTVGAVLLGGPATAAVAWLLPALAVTTGSIALSPRLGPQRAAAAVGGGWILAVIAVGSVSGHASGAFDPPGQVFWLLVATMAGILVERQRRRSRYFEA